MVMYVMFNDATSQVYQPISILVFIVKHLHVYTALSKVCISLILISINLCE